MLISVKDACQLQDNALDIRVSDQIEQLDELIKMEGNGEAFFARTHITHGMRTLVTEGLARLAGQSNQAVFHLKQALGGGKTHLLIGFGLLARDPDLRVKVCSDVPHIRKFNTARVAAFNGRNSPPHFFWGEVAHQLGKPEQFRGFWAGGPKAPDEQDWLKLYEGDEPVLILLDEMPPYFQYLGLQPIGNGTVADIATRAFANMLTAAGKKANVCIVVSDLTVTYAAGMKLIERALEDARQELGRQERPITPVDLAANEVYEILRKRLFKALPPAETINEVAAHFGRTLEEASKAKVAKRGAEAIADEIVQTYPFHPRLKNVVALFKENEQFKQTRGLMELVSRLLKSVWLRPANDVYLIGPQHFALSIPEVREKLVEISDMGDVVAKDLWDANSSAHAQLIDLGTGSDAAAQVASLLLTASLSTAVNAVKGLTREEMVECLVAPLRTPSEFLTAFDALEQDLAWYLHHTSEYRYYFDRQENLNKLLKSLAKDAPEPQVDALIRSRLQEMFRPARKTAYTDVAPLPKIDEVAERVRKSRVLLIVSPEGNLPPAEVKRLFDGLAQKNNLCILSGDKTQMGSVEEAARQVFAAQKADSRIPKSHAQREELEDKQQRYEQNFNTTVLNLFDKVFFPVQLPGRAPELRHKPLDMSHDAQKPFSGEEQIEKTLTSNPLKLYLDVDAEFEAIRSKAEVLLWPENQAEARWTDIVDRMAEQAGMPWLPPRGLDDLKSMAVNRGLWEDLGNGYVTKKPQKKKTSAQVIPDTEPDDDGQVRLRVNAQNAGPAPKIYYEEDGPVTERSPVLTDQFLYTRALRVNFLVHDPSGQYDNGDPVPWSNKLTIRNELVEEGGRRMVKLFVAPRGELRYTLDGSEPRNGTPYSEPFPIADGEVLVRVFAGANGLEAKSDFPFPARGKKGVQIDDAKPAELRTDRGSKKLDSRAKTFEALGRAKESGILFENVTLAIGQGAQSVGVTLLGLQVGADYIESILDAVMGQFEPAAPVTMSFRRAIFASGFDLRQFAEGLGLPIQPGEVVQ